MNIQYREPAVSIEDGLRVRVLFEAENSSTATWRPSDGFAFGHQIFDPITETLVVDGERDLLREDVPPSGSVKCNLVLDLPPQPGRYRVFVSPMRENVAWYYDRGWPFLMIDAVVSNGRAAIAKLRLTSSRALRRERLGRAIRRLFSLPVLTIVKNLSLIQTMVQRDVLGRYRGSFGGGLWTVLMPLLLMLTYFFVFGIVLETRFRPGASRAEFALYFLAGMLPWLAFSEALGRAPTVLLEHRNFVKKLVFPVESLPVNLVVSGLVNQAVALVLFIIALLLARQPVPATAAWLPLLIAPQILLTLGLCWFLSALGVFVRDLGQIIGFVLTLWFFLTPICYPEASLPSGAMAILSQNPVYVLVRGYRDILLEGRVPDWASVGRLWAVSALVFIAGHAWFYKLRRSFADFV